MDFGTAGLVIGIDGGGSRCRGAVAGPDGRVLGRGEGGPANVSSDFSGALSSLAEAVARALAAAGRTAEGVVAVHAGLAGVMRPADGARVAAALTAAALGGISPPGGVTVTDDRPTSVAGALAGRDGALAAVGTGSFVALARGGALRCVGGWGAAVGDQASGAWLGRRLLERTLLWHDGLAPETPLLAATLRGFGGDPVAIVEFAASARPAELAALAPRVADAAEGADAAGSALMQEGADYLARALDALGLSGGEVLCLSGGLGPRYAPHLRADLRARLARPAGDALDGAVRLALRAGAGRRGAA
jgi:glucosamine kinase